MAKFHVGQLCMLKNCIVLENNGKVVQLTACHGLTRTPLPNKQEAVDVHWDFLPEMKAWNGGKAVAGEYQLIPINPDTDGTDDESHAYLPSLSIHKQKEDAHV